MSFILTRLVVNNNAVSVDDEEVSKEFLTRFEYLTKRKYRQLEENVILHYDLQVKRGNIGYLCN